MLRKALLLMLPLAAAWLAASQWQDIILCVPKPRPRHAIRRYSPIRQPA
jgi:hypothetical protein